MKRLFIFLVVFLVVLYSVAFAEEIPVFEGYPIIEQNDNYPEFTVKDLTVQAFDVYSELDSLGRTGSAMACIGKESLPHEERGLISDITPSGWKNSWYDSIEDGYVYN